MTGNKTQRQWIGLSYRFATMLIALLFITTGKVKAQTAYYSFDGSTMTIYYGSQIPSGCYAMGPWNAPKWISSTSTDKQNNATKVIFDSSFKNAKPTSCRQWFFKFIALKTVEGLENLNTSDVEDMYSMFENCYNLTDLNVSHFNTSKVKNMANMFYGCKLLTHLNVSNFKTENVTDMSGMFAECPKLAYIDVANFNTAKVTNMNTMFYNCNSITNLNLSNFNTANVTSMIQMFGVCNQLTTLDLSSFSTYNVTAMHYMFMNCSNLATIYASDAFNIDKVATGSEMFSGCTKNLVGATQFNDKHTDVDMANNKNGYFMPYYKDKDGKHPIYENGVKKTISLHLYNQNPFYTQTTFDIDEGSYTRESMASDWGTVCVPFVTDVANSNCTFYQLNSMGTDAIEISPISGEDIPAGTPVIVKRNDGEKDLKVIAKACEIVADPANETGANHLEGTFQDLKVSKKCYFLAKNKFWYVGQIAEDGTIKGVHVYPFRAYLTCADDAQQTNSLNIVVKDETNSVENPVAIDSLFSDKAEYYDAAGRRIPTLQKGLNIVRVGGQTRKVMIK